MATRNIVPRATGEGQIGTSAKTWSAGYFNDIAVTNGVTAGTFTGDLVGDVTGDVTGNVTGDVTGDVTGNVTGDVTGTASGNMPLSGGTMTGTMTWEGADSDTFDIGFSDANQDNVDVGWTYNDKSGAGIGLRNVSHDDGGVFNLWATDGVNIKTLVGKADGSFKWDGHDVATIISLGSVPNNTTKTFTLPSAGTYLLFTGHNSSPGMCGMWMIRTGGNSAFRLAGGADVTVTCSSTTITVKPTAGSAGVWAVKFPAV